MSRLHFIDAPGPGRLAITARPRAGDWLEAEIDAWKQAGLDLVISLLERGEVAELDLQGEAALCKSRGIDFVSFPIPDRGLPAPQQEALRIARLVAAGLRDGRTMAIHCRAGIGRSSIMAASALICSGAVADEALALIGAARGVAVPDTDEQRDWVIAFGESLRDDATSA